MNHSIYSVDRATHVKIVVVALAVAVASLAISSHVKFNDLSIQTAAAIKAGKPMTVTGTDLVLAR